MIQSKAIVFFINNSLLNKRLIISESSILKLIHYLQANTTKWFFTLNITLTCQLKIDCAALLLRYLRFDTMVFITFYLM